MPPSRLVTQEAFTKAGNTVGQPIVSRPWGRMAPMVWPVQLRALSNVRLSTMLTV